MSTAGSMTGHRRALLLALGAAILLPIVTVAGLVSGPPSPDGPFIVSLSVLTLTNALVGVAIVWRRPDNRVGSLLIVGSLMLSVSVVAWPWLGRSGTPPTGPLASVLAWWSPIAVLPSVFVLFPTVGVVFPDGHLPGSRWTRPYGVITAILLAGIALQTIAPMPVDAAAGSFGNPFAVSGVAAEVGAFGATLTLIAVMAGFLIAVASVVVRYRRSRGVERAQVTWLVAAVTLTAALFVASYAIDIGPEGMLDLPSVLVSCLVPIAIGIAVLRYHLYDIDRLVSRTLSWAIVSAGIGSIFIGLVVGLGAMLSDLIRGETLAVALSTLIAAGLFQPIRRRVQRAVDVRFDRAHVDAQRTADAFAERSRDEVDLERLLEVLVQTTGTAVRPSASSVWLRPMRGIKG